MPTSTAGTLLVRLRIDRGLRHAARRAVVVGIAAVGLCGVGAGPASARPAHPTHPVHPVHPTHPYELVPTAVHVDYSNPTPLVYVSVVPEGASFRIVATADTNWHADLEGTTHYTMSALFDPATGITTGDIDETFTGSVLAVGTGTLHFAETFSMSAAGEVVLEAEVVDATGALADVRGHLTCTGESDSDGVGNGVCDGVLDVPDAPQPGSSTTTSAAPTTSTVPTTPSSSSSTTTIVPRSTAAPAASAAIPSAAPVAVQPRFTA